MILLMTMLKPKTEELLKASNNPSEKLEEDEKERMMELNDSEDKSAKAKEDP